MTGKKTKNLTTDPLKGKGIRKGLRSDPKGGKSAGSKTVKLRCLPPAKGQREKPQHMSLKNASQPMTLEQRLTAEDLQPSKIQPLVTIFEERAVPEKPNHVKDTEMDDGLWGQDYDAVNIDPAAKRRKAESTPVSDLIEMDEAEIERLLSVSNSDIFGGDSELLAQAEDALDKAEVRDGVRRGHVANGADTFNQVCAEMDVPQQLRPCFWQWLQNSDRPGPKFTPDQVPRKGGKVKAGTKVPRPDGKLWRSLRDAAVAGKDVSERISAFSGEINDTSQLRVQREEDRLNTQLATEVVRAWDAVKANCVGNEFQDVAIEKIIESRTPRDSIKVMQAKSRLKSKDCLAKDGIIPPPKGIKAMLRHELTVEWQAAMAKEISSLTEMGTITHLHTAAALLERGIDIVAMPAAHTHMVFDNKIKPDPETLRAVLEKLKARMVVDGGPTVMTKHVHYEETFSATPKLETCRLTVVLRVLLKLESLCFDVSNAFGWAKRDKPMALHYPRGMDQYDRETGERLYMALWLNTYGTPDGGNIWQAERNNFVLEHFNKGRWTVKRCFMDQCMFYFNYFTDEAVGPEEVEEARARSGSVKDFEEKPVRGETSLRMSMGGKRVHEVWMVVWTDDFDGVGTCMTMMKEIMEACNNEWAVKEVPNDYMVGVKRIFETDDAGVEHGTLLMPSYIDGIEALCYEHLVKAGWITGKAPMVPFPKEQLTLHDPDGKITDTEANRVLERGFNTVKGLTMWAARCAFPECKFGNSQLSKVASRPSELAWDHMMHMVAWMIEHKHRGVRFNGDGNKIPVAYVDASNKQDPKSGKCQYGFDIRMAGGPFITHSSLLTNVGYGAPSQEHMALSECVGHMSIRWTCATVLWMRRLFSEIGLSAWVEDPTTILSDSVTAIDWAKFGKITPGNNYLALAYHQVREWVENNTVAPVHIRGWDNISDLGTKPVEKQVIDRLLRFYVGLEDTLPEYIPPISKKKLKQAADDVAQMIALGVNQVTAANMARLKM